MRIHAPTLAVALVACSTGNPAAQRPADGAAPVVRATVVAATERFEFQSDPWINLHHFLYQWAREERGLGRGRQHVTVPERASLADLSDEKRSRWLQAVGFYGDSVAARSHWDRAMLSTKAGLLSLAGDPRALPPDRIKGLAAALMLAMPIYQEKWWPQHNSANRAWIVSVVPRLRNHEARFVEMTTRVYGATWPTTRWRVDASAYANAGGGYTTSEGHIVIYATDLGIQDLYALETLFHEVQHAEAVGGTIADTVERVFTAAGSKAPSNLWHALIFATAGEFTRSVAEREGLPAHNPYWIREGFDRLDGWRTLVPAVDAHWPPVVRGDASREEALAALTHVLRNP